MARIAVGVEYDGSSFSGWQQQVDVPSIQQALQSALGTVCDHPVEITGAGRTDAGVHAREQVAHFDSDAGRTERALLLGANSNLPPGVALRWVRHVPDHFHARYSAVTRCYRYCIFNRGTRSALASGRAMWVYQPLRLEPMVEAARMLVGTHDFSSFRAAECQAKSPVRILKQIEVQRAGDFVLVEVSANAFLHHMVRNIAGALLAVGDQRKSPAWIAELLAGRNRSAGAETAPAAGLYLVDVEYPAEFSLPQTPYGPLVLGNGL